jgi:hypothetical protein
MNGFRLPNRIDAHWGGVERERREGRRRRGQSTGKSVS